ncbi:MAG: UDP-N-acetylmuramoyl-L-alanyl-D-glutamate--2,6-diaminopimelate ligase, partial [Chloroflexota bacterium]
MSKSLSQLFAEFPFDFSPLDADPPITDVTGDSRQVRPGALFVAIPGGSFDGHRFIPEAVSRGAAAVAGSQPAPSGLNVPYVRVENPRQALAHLAAAVHDHPARRMTMIGVTGTDGKTTTTNLLYQILKTAGLKVGMISTVNAVIGDRVLDTGFHVTTPDAPEVQKYLAMMRDAGLTHVVLETTSHGWAQHRVDACEFDLAVVTNITHEHLNDHGSLENYRAAKARLFESLALTRPKPQGNPRLAVLNRDDFSHDYLLDRLPGLRHVSYGLGGEADIRAENITYSPSGIQFRAVGDGLGVPVTCKLVGAFNVSNALAAFAASVRGLGLDPVTAARGVAELTGIPGRMERIDLGQPFTAIVDFAHTPNALKVATQAARTMLSASPLPAWGEG